MREEELMDWMNATPLSQMGKSLLEEPDETDLYLYQALLQARRMFHKDHRLGRKYLKFEFE